MKLCHSCQGTACFILGKNPMMTGMHVLSACDTNTEMVGINFVLVQWIVDAVSITGHSDNENCDASQ